MFAYPQKLACAAVKVNYCNTLTILQNVAGLLMPHQWRLVVHSSPGKTPNSLSRFLSIHGSEKAAAAVTQDLVRTHRTRKVIESVLCFCRSWMHWVSERDAAASASRFDFRQKNCITSGGAPGEIAGVRVAQELRAVQIRCCCFILFETGKCIFRYIYWFNQNGSAWTSPWTFEITKRGPPL